MSRPQPEDAKSRVKLVDFVLAAAVVFVLAAVVYQTFLRYTYVHTVGNTVVRVDRASGERCILPCEQNAEAGTPIVVPPSSPPEKECHPANVVRVADVLRPPVLRSPTPYIAGGFPALTARHRWHDHALRHAVELSDGHIYAFSKEAYAADVVNWSTGADVQVCATWSRLSHRPYYSVGASGDPEPATIAL